MAFLQYNLPGSSITGDVSEPTGNYHNENSIHKLTAVPNFLLPSASKSRSPNAALRTIAQQVEGELGKQGMTSLGDGISKTHTGTALLGCARQCGEHTDTPWQSQLLESEPQHRWDCPGNAWECLTRRDLRSTGQTRMGLVPAPAAIGDQKHGRGSKPGAFSAQDPRKPVCGSCWIPAFPRAAAFSPNGWDGAGILLC